ncbi:MAG: 2-C-methyl-D-erythritol 4-phosphate cytidylyltransferase [SAR324 cluster bacterium]|nr:2-C-methyl-D-erythritol 4-phosphate cytidylyltransferase [SAR324 cluster bacterium]
MPEKATVIIPAAGRGKRMAAEKNKLFLPLGSRTILQHTLNLFLQHPQIDHIFLVVAGNDQEMLTSLLASEEKITVVTGGAERQDSVWNALELIQQSEVMPRWILVHDGARPLCPSIVIERILKQCALSGAAIPVVPLVDTIRKITPQHTKVLNRSQLFATQTPQGFDAQLLIEAYRCCKKERWQTTDDASVVELFGHSVETVDGVVENLKITTPQDLKFAEWLLNQQEHGVTC